MTKFQIGITGALAVAGATGFVSQARTNATLQDEVAALRKETVGIGQLRDENLRLARTVAEADSLRREGETFVRMSAEAEDLDRRFRQVARLNAAKIASSETYDVKKVDQLPKMVRSKPPAYPKVLRDGGVQGEVLVEFIVTAEGAVRDAKVVSSSHPDFEEPSLAAVREWAFDPGIKSGRNVNTRMQVPLKFALQNETGTAGNPEPKANPDARKG